MTRLLHMGLAVTAVATVIATACSAGKTENDGDGASDASVSSSGGTSSANGGDGGTSSDGGAGPGSGGDLSGVGAGAGGTGGAGGGSGGMMGCAEFTAEAQAEPAAMLVTLDRSASMRGTKWNASQFAIVSAIDKDVFDTMSLGLMAFPHGYVDPPECICVAIGVPGDPPLCQAVFEAFTGNAGVSCGFTGLPNIPIGLAGVNKSNAATGVRREIYDYLVDIDNAPLNNGDDGSPIYDALSSGYQALKLVPGVSERIQLLITDGGFSCASLSARGGYTDANGCDDWELPSEVNTLIDDQFNDATTPVRTFIVGVPGSDTNGEQTCNGTDCYDTPPYSMKNALSSYAVSGSPDTIDPACDGQTFAFPGTDPTTPCHIDMTTGVFDANALADVIAGIRGTALGCVYPMPTPPAGSPPIDPTKVNVDVTINGVGPTTIPARSTPSDDCAVNACWDYDLSGNIEILGKGCDDISTASTAKVDIVVGCDTIIN